MFLIIFYLLQIIAAQPSIDRVNITIISTPTVSSFLTLTHTPTQAPIHTSTHVPSYISTETPSQILTPTYYNVNFDSNTSTVTSTQSPVPGSMKTYNISLSASFSPYPSNINTDILNNSPIMSSSNITGIAIGGILILSTTVSILGYYYIKNINKSNSPVSSTMSEKGDSKILIQENPVLEPMQENNHIKKRWTQYNDGRDTWYVSSDGDSAWVLPENAILENKI